MDPRSFTKLYQKKILYCLNVYLNAYSSELTLGPGGTACLIHRAIRPSRVMKYHVNKFFFSKTPNV